MKIAMALCRADEAEALIRAGADEFYAGVDTPDYPFSLNRRELPHGNFPTFEELARATALAHDHGVPVHVTLNKAYYHNEELGHAARVMERALECGAVGFIISDPGLMEYALSLRLPPGVKLHLSSVSAAMNSQAIAFFLQYGFTRAILPRLTLDEIHAVRRAHPALELEVMTLGWRCPNMDGLCAFQHDLKQCAAAAYPDTLLDNGCCLAYAVRPAGPAANDPALLKSIRKRFSTVLYRMSAACEACYMLDLENAGVNVVKVVARLLDKKQKFACLKFLKRCAAFIADAPSRQEYAFQVKRLYKSSFGFDCRDGCILESKQDAL